VLLASGRSVEIGRKQIACRHLLLRERESAAAARYRHDGNLLLLPVNPRLQCCRRDMVVVYKRVISHMSRDDRTLA
jgi:hypothetical protein